MEIYDKNQELTMRTNETAKKKKNLIRIQFAIKKVSF
jgi:hypothetical protein